MLASQAPIKGSERAESRAEEAEPDSFEDEAANPNGTTDLDQQQQSIQDSVPEHSVLSPRNEQVWLASTKSRLGRAKSLRQAAEGELQKSTVGVTEGRSKHDAVGNKMQSHLRKKIDTTHNLARSLWDRTTGTEETIRHIGHSIFQLTRAQQATQTPLDVVGRCLELRRARPTPENVHDHFQKALEEEQACLMYSRQQFTERVEVSRGMLQELEQAKTLLHQDMVRKRHASRLDRTCHTMLHHQRVAVEEEEQDAPYTSQRSEGERPADGGSPYRATQLPRMSAMKRGEVDPKSPFGGPLGPRPQSAGQPNGQGSKGQIPYSARASTGTWPGEPDCTTQSGKWHDNAQQLLANTHDLCVTASRLCVKNEECLHERQKECDTCRKMVVETMRKRLVETADLRKQLEKEMRETDFAVTGMQEGLAETERQCEMHNVPLTQLKLSMQAREKRKGGEQIRDTVTLAKEDVLSVINNNIRALQEQFKRKKKVLTEMIEMRAQLQEDLRFKIQALSIDNQCSKLLTRPHSARLGATPPPKDAISKPHFRRKAQGVSQPRGKQQQPAENMSYNQRWQNYQQQDNHGDSFAQQNYQQPWQNNQQNYQPWQGGQQQDYGGGTQFC